jgi:hypothetical protein
MGRFKAPKNAHPCFFADEADGPGVNIALENRHSKKNGQPKNPSFLFRGQSKRALEM